MTVTAIAPADAGVTVGTFFRRAWGYDQTNIDFYKVVGLTPKGVRLQHWANKVTDDNGYGAEHVVPGEHPATHNVWPTVEQAELEACPDCRGYATDTWGPTVAATAVHFCDAHGPKTQDKPIRTKRLGTYDGKTPYVAVGPYNDHAYLWDGTPEYQTAPGWGH